ncbi:MAG: carotenoid biosynthesis protein [Halobacteriota archaeon]
MALSEIAGIVPAYLPHQITFARQFGYILVLFVVFHALRSLKFRAPIFLGLAFAAGALSELLGTTYGWIYGQRYYYTASDKVFGLVPFSVLITWIAVIYLAYSITNIIDPAKNLLALKKVTRVGSFIYVLLLSTLDGFLAMNLDMILDPVYVRSGGWVWQDGGAYFGVPISNFIGWFFVAFATTLIFRSYSLRKPFNTAQKIDFIFFAPVIAYAIFGIVKYGILSYVMGHIEYAIIGISVMFPFIAIATLSYQLKRSTPESTSISLDITKDINLIQTEGTR